MTAAVAVVTDSTACLTAEMAADSGIRVVPLRVVLGDRAADEEPAGQDGLAGGPTVTVAEVERVLHAGGRVGTASPAPGRFATAYAAAAAGGAESIVSVHISARLSGTLNWASVAAARAPVPVWVVDSQSIGLGLGIVALTAAAAANAGQSAAAVAAAAASRAARLRSFFAVDTPSYMRTGGRLEPTAALRDSSLTARPLLHIRDGQIVVLEKARTPAGAIRRLEQLAAESAAGQPADLAVQYVAEADRAAALARRLGELIPGVRHTYLAAADAVISAHTGPGMLAVVVAPY